MAKQRRFVQPKSQTRKTILGIVFLAACAIVPLSGEEIGYASYYAGKFQGRLTANGEIFDTKRFTAAHKTLPFNTIVRVTNIENDETTFVRINDRGPFVEGRVIDLSRVAAASIGMVAAGIARVRVDVVSLGDNQTYHRTGYESAFFSVQVAAFGKLENAERMKEALESSGFDVIFEPNGNEVVRVIVPAVPREDILLTKSRLQALGYFNVIVRSE